MDHIEFAEIRRMVGTQDQVARGIGIKIKRLQSWEQGYRPLPLWATKSLLWLARDKGKKLQEIHKILDD